MPDKGKIAMGYYIMNYFNAVSVKGSNVPEKINNLDKNSAKAITGYLRRNLTKMSQEAQKPEFLVAYTKKMGVEDAFLSATTELFISTLANFTGDHIFGSANPTDNIGAKLSKAIVRADESFETDSYRDGPDTESQSIKQELTTTPAAADDDADDDAKSATSNENFGQEVEEAEKDLSRRGTPGMTYSGNLGMSKGQATNQKVAESKLIQLGYYASLQMQDPLNNAQTLDGVRDIVNDPDHKKNFNAFAQKNASTLRGVASRWVAPNQKQLNDDRKAEISGALQSIPRQMVQKSFLAEWYRRGLVVMKTLMHNTQGRGALHFSTTGLKGNLNAMDKDTFDSFIQFIANDDPDKLHPVSDANFSYDESYVALQKYFSTYDDLDDVVKQLEEMMMGNSTFNFIVNYDIPFTSRKKNKNKNKKKKGSSWLLESVDKFNHSLWTQETNYKTKKTTWAQVLAHNY